MIIHSLIIATLNRKKELYDLLKSIESLNYNLNSIEVIVVDQNESDVLRDIVQSFPTIKISQIKSPIKGLSLNRNIGIKQAKGKIISFPDDDCKLYPDTLSKVDMILKNEIYDFCLGRIYDRKEMAPIMKKWPKKALSINKLNSYFLNSSITLYVKKEILLPFDENLGVGGKFGSCEDADLIYRILENEGKGIYTPHIEVWHPNPSIESIKLDKVENYASGFGYFIAKETDFTKLGLFLGLNIKKMFQFLLKSTPKDYFRYFYRGLIRGMMKK